MRMMGYMYLMIITVVLPHTVGLADTASHRQAAETLLTVMKAEQNLQEDADRLVANLLEQNPQLASHDAAIKTFVTKYVNWASLKEDVIALYVKEFTEDELMQLTTFYRSPIGQKAVDKMPQLANAGTKIGVSRLQKNQEELQQIIGAEQKQQK